MDYGQFYSKNYYKKVVWKHFYLNSEIWMKHFAEVADKIIETINLRQF